jgi:hypothetical protein
MAVSFPKRTDKQTLERLLASGKLNPLETADIQGSYDAVLAGKELDSNQRLRANTLHNKYELGEESARAGRRRGQDKTDELLARFDAMPRPKRPPGK